MDKAEQTTYLRNVLLVAAADGVMDTTEEAFIESVRASIGATKGTLQKARKQSTDTAELSSLSRLSDRIKCLEDMIGCAIVDGDLPTEEAQLVMLAADAIGVPEELMNTILSEAQARHVAAMLPCPACGTEFASDAKFCNECGTSLVERKRTEIGVPDAGITISFAQSTSADFPKALELAKAQGSYQETDGKPQWFAATFPASAAADAARLANLVAGLRHREVYLDGTSQDWSAVFKFAKCMAKRHLAYQKGEYCVGAGDVALNPWGCRQLGLKWAPFSSLFRCGAFEADTRFKFDKRKLAHELNQRLAGVSLCPHFSRDFAVAAFEHLPEVAEVDPSGAGDWNYNFVDTPSANSRQVVLFNRTYLVDGVVPTDSRIIQGLLDAVAAACHVQLTFA